MGSLLIVVSTPSLAFSPRIVEAHEPMHVQTFPSEIAIERLDEGIVSGLARSREVERDTAPVNRRDRDRVRPILFLDRTGLPSGNRFAADLFEDLDCMSSEHFGQLAWQFKRMSGSSG